MKNRRLELLAPAKNKQCGIEAIRHGADAVYIGAERFGARVAAGNSVEDIAELCRYAHVFGAKVYVTINTLLYDDELHIAESLLKQIQLAGADAVLIQDLRLLDLMPEGLEVHASTQTDLRSIERVRELMAASQRDNAGVHSRSMFKRIVLAREMPIEEIRQVHKEFPELELECFVHGALCVSYSGACYASEYCFQRSANRGECAQFCRLPFDLLDAEGKTLIYAKHLLSLKDMCRIDNLEELAEAGICSFKIEGRLKDTDYVKNVIAAYSQRLNKVIKQSNKRFVRSSYGDVTYSFRPDLKRTFNRGYTDYFLHGRKPNIENFVTPKSIGKPVGKVKDKANYWFSVASSESFANGDGLCFIDDKHRMHGFRVNKVEGNRLFPQNMPAELQKGMTLFRNHDEAFTKLLQGKTAERKIEIKMRLEIEPQQLTLKVFGLPESLTITTPVHVVSRSFPEPLAIAQKPQREHILRNLMKLGGTPYICIAPEIVSANNQDYFIPASIISAMRQEVLGALEVRTSGNISTQISESISSHSSESISAQSSESISAHSSESVSAHSSESVSAHSSESLTAMTSGSQDSQSVVQSSRCASNLSESRNTDLQTSLPLMQCKHCLRYALGYCSKEQREAPAWKEQRETPAWKEPLMLRMSDGRMFRLEFDCKHCQMNVWANR